MDNVYIIAEAGVNHNGDFNLAKQMILEAKYAGVNAIKFQTFIAKNLVTKYSPKAEYQKNTTNTTESQLSMLEKLELSFEQFSELSRYAKEIDIDFISTPFDNESIDFLNTLNMPYWKIPSGEITNKPYLFKLAQTKKRIILSTGMSTIDEINEALLIFKHYSRKDISLLHCNTEYPTPYQDVNLNVLKTLKDTFGVQVGYSDHTQGIEISLAAVALGAKIIEKHFTLDRSMIGPDHKASLEANELRSLVDSIRNIEAALGTNIKLPTRSEDKNKVIARKSIVAQKHINKGDVFTELNLTTKRPGDGISPMNWCTVLGKVASREYNIDEKIDENELGKNIN